MINRLIYLVVLACFSSSPACASGLFLAKNNNQVISKQTQIVMARKGAKSILTLTSDFQTKAGDVVLVVPLPMDVKNVKFTNVQYENIDELNRYTSPRLIEYVDFDPCNPDAMKRPEIKTDQSFTTIDMDKAIGLVPTSLKITAAHNFVSLSSKESVGIDIWLRKKHGFVLTEAQLAMLRPYIDAAMKFVIIEIQAVDDEATQLMPVQISYESDSFTVPFKIGALNAPSDQAQAFTLYSLSSHGEVLPQNFKIKDMPVNIDLPAKTVSEFDSFYGKLSHNIFTAHPEIMRKEYAWPMGSCKPCTTKPLSVADLSSLGTFWYQLPKDGRIGLVAPFAAIYITRFHAQYTVSDAGILPEILELQESAERPKYQTFYNIRYPIAADLSACKGNFAAELARAERKENDSFDMLVR